MKLESYIKLVSSVDSNKKSVLEMNILPGEKTPWHYHTLFSETFEVSKGRLKIGKGKKIHRLKEGESATIEPDERHYFTNISQEECIVKVTIDPGNKNFENALFIMKGLAKDGLTSDAGTPRKLVDLAVFVHLNNSRMTGLRKIAEPIFNYIAKAAIKRGYLSALIQKYC